MHRQRLHQATMIPFSSFPNSSFRHQAFHQPSHEPLRYTDTLQNTLLLHKPPATQRHWHATSTLRLHKPPATQRHWHATKHTPSAQATSHSETLTRHKAHSFFTSHQPLRHTVTPQSTLLLHKPPATPPATHWHAITHTPSAEATSHSETLTRHIQHNLWNPQVHYNVRKSAALVLTLSQHSPVHEILSYFCNIHFVIVMPSAPRFPIHLFSESFLTKTQYAFIFTLMRSTWP